MYQEQFMKRAIALSAQALQTPGTEPFAALVVKDGAVVGEGFNHSVAHFDPTSHGEIEAIRDGLPQAADRRPRRLRALHSCEPFALCVAAMRIAGIGQLYYAASLAQSGAVFEGVPSAARHPIDVKALARRPVRRWSRRQAAGRAADGTDEVPCTQGLSDWAEADEGRRGAGRDLGTAGLMFTYNRKF